MGSSLPSAVVIDPGHDELQRKLGMGGKFAADLQAPHGEDVATFNLFQALRRFDADLWLPRLFREAGLEPPSATHHGAELYYWRSGAPTQERQEWLRANVGRHGVKAHENPEALMEGRSQIDVIIEHAAYCVVIEVKRDSDVDTRVTYQDGYDQLARQLDLAERMEAEGQRPTFVWLLAVDASRQPIGFERCAAYRDPTRILEVCRHFSAEQARRRAERLGTLTWASALAVLRELSTDVARVVDWFAGSGL